MTCETSTAKIPLANCARVSRLWQMDLSSCSVDPDASTALGLMVNGCKMEESFLKLKRTVFSGLSPFMKSLTMVSWG